MSSSSDVTTYHFMRSRLGLGPSLQDATGRIITVGEEDIKWPVKCLPCGQEFHSGAGYATHEPCVPMRSAGCSACPYTPNCIAQGDACERHSAPGAQRDVKPSKAPLDRLGEVPRALRALASQIEYGSSKPGREPGDWRRLKRHEFIAKALRHLVDAAAGELLDPEGRSHLVAAMTDCALAVEMEGREP